MRIAFVTSEFPPETGKGGIGTYVDQASRMLAKAGCDVHVFAASQRRSADVLENDVHIHWVECAGPREFQEAVVTPFEQQHRIRAFDVVESPEIHANAGGVKKQFPALPLVVRLHAPSWIVEHTKKKYNPLTTKLRPVIGALLRGRIDLGYWGEYDAANDPDRQFAMMADSITAPSSIMKSWAVKHWGIDGNSIAVIPNPFVPPEEFLELPVPPRENIEVVFFGRLNVLKGLVNATRAMARILETHPACRFKVIGDDAAGPDQTITMREWMRARLTPYLERVEFSDGIAHDEIPAAIANANVALLPSLFESFSYTCAEAMAAGKAVVGSRGTGMQDLIAHESTGMLVDPENPDEIFAAVHRLLTDEDLTRRISLAARERISSQFAGEKLARVFIDHYRRVVA